MTRTSALWDHCRPWLHVMDADGSARVADLLPPGGTCVAVRFDGREMADTQSLFERFAAELRFPVHFGWNWPAFSECLRDMSWMPANHYLVVVTAASGLLAEEPSELGTFLRIMNDVGSSWSHTIGLPETAGGKHIAFNTVLLDSADEIDAVSAHASRARMPRGSTRQALGAPAKNEP